MIQERIGVLHPGAMGVSVAASAKAGGNDVCWASEGRSVKTQERASQAGLRDVGSLARLCATCSTLISVCPPHAAEEVAAQVLANSYSGVCLDANAISPQRVIQIGEKMAGAGVTFVDGGIIGGPAWEPGRTWLYLSGQGADRVAALFAAGPLETEVIDEEVGRASALKMCYASWTKGTTALLCAILATADNLGVWPELQRQWNRNWPGFDEEAIGRVTRVTAKAWRFAGEMDEIAATFRGSGLPGEFHAGAADVYQRLAGFKDADATPSLEEVLTALQEED